MMPKFAVILPAGGSGTRFGSDKLLERIGGVSVLRRSVEAFDREEVAMIIVGTDNPMRQRELAGLDVTFTPGGRTRAHTVRAALNAVPNGVTLVAIHDAARPLVSGDLISRTFAHAAAFGPTVPALAARNTIKLASGPLPATVESTPPRERLWEMQTPQVMPVDRLRDAYARTTTPLEAITDDAQLLESVGDTVWLVDGDERNLKITTPLDLAVASLLIARDGQP